ncbi:unnamed protein product, partial [Prorocentrum cordatum]
MAEGADWRLPLCRQRWLRRVEKHAHVTWAFGPSGEFGANFPPKMRRFLTSRSKADAPPAAPEPPASARGGPAAAAAGSDRWAVDGLFPPVAALRVRSCQHRVLFILCTHKSGWLLPHARGLIKDIVRLGDVQERDEDTEIQAALELPGGIQFTRKAFTVARVVGGPFDGLQCVGVHSDRETRLRAVRLGLAAAARVLAPAPGGRTEDPTRDGEFAALVRRAGRLLSQPGGAPGGE